MKNIVKVVLKLFAGVLLGTMFFAVPMQSTHNYVYAAQAGSSGSDKSFSANPSDGYKGLRQFADTVIKLFSWLWVVPAILAGKLMNNDFVYGKVFNLDVYLWKMWNMMKVFANYGLGFSFLILVIKTFFEKEPSSKIKQFLPQIFIVGVLIQASWFLVGALIDVSTIMTAAVASVPAKMIKDGSAGDYNKVIDKLAQNIRKECTYNNDIKKEDTPFANCSEEKIEVTDSVRDYLTPNYKSIDGVLVFLGYAIFRFQDMDVLSSDQTAESNIAISFMIRALLILSFAVPMFILFFTNLIRVFYIRLWIVFSPIVIFLQMGKAGDKIKESAGKVGKNLFSVKNMIGLIFQPVAVVGALSIAFMLVLGLSKVFYGMAGSDGSSAGTNPFGVEKCTDSGNAACGKIGDTGANITVKGSIIKDMGDIVGGSLGYLILTIFTVYLIWGVVRIGFHTSEITAGFAEAGFGFVNKMMKSVPFLPGGVSVGALGKASSQLERNVVGSRSAQQSTALTNAINNLAGIKGGITENELLDLKNKRQNSNDYRTYTSSYFNGLHSILAQKPAPLTDPTLKRAIETWANDDWGRRYLTDYVGVTFDTKDNITVDKLTSDSKGMSFLDQVLSGKLQNLENKDGVVDALKNNVQYSTSKSYPR